jgi:hypothetical protein
MGRDGRAREPKQGCHWLAAGLPRAVRNEGQVQKMRVWLPFDASLKFTTVTVVAAAGSRVKRSGHDKGNSTAKVDTTMN